MRPLQELTVTLAAAELGLENDALREIARGKF